MSTRIGIGILGSGFMGRTYSETITKYLADEAELVGIACGSRGPALAEDYSVPFFEEEAELIRNDEVRALFIATPHHLHSEQALAGASAGKHLLIEKPMACSVAECDHILAACKAKDLKCSIGFSQRTRTCNLKAKEILESGQLGKIQQIRTYQTVPGGMPNLPKWQMDKDNLGVLFGHGIHNFDMVRWLTGQEIESVYAVCRNLENNDAVEGHSDVLMSLSDGATAYFLCSFQLPKPGFPRSQFATRVLCEKGLLDIDAYGEARVAIQGGDWETVAIQEPIDWQGKGALDPVRLATYIAHGKDFLASIREDRDPSITGWDGRQAVAAALAAYESSKTGQAVKLN
jgi:predicted dehydrogenase